MLGIYEELLTILFHVALNIQAQDLALFAERDPGTEEQSVGHSWTLVENRMCGALKRELHFYLEPKWLLGRRRNGREGLL